MDQYRWRRDHAPGFHPKERSMAPQPARTARLVPTGRVRWMFTTAMPDEDPMPQLRFGIHGVKLQQEVSDGSATKWIDVVVEFPCSSKGNAK